MPDLSRRDFLKLTRNSLLYLSELLALGGLIRFLEYQTDPHPKTEFELGPATAYLLGSRTILPDVPAVLLHTESGFSALSLVCTHLGCTVDQSADGFACPCHGSQFDSQGNVLHGPANKQLAILRVEETSDGHLHLFTT